MSIKISQNFTLEEIVPQNYIKNLNSIQRLMIDNICQNILEPIREYLGCPLQITSGLRTLEDYNRLKNKGKNPSLTSDHFYGIPVPLDNSLLKQVYGEYYIFSTGAVDFIPRMDIRLAWEKLRKCFDVGRKPFIHLPKQTIKINQIIFEGNWIHISNPKTLVFSEEVSKKFITNHFLISEDNGLTYRKV